MGWVIALTVVFLLAIFPVGFRALYMDSGPCLWILIGPVKYQIIPSKPGKKNLSNKEKKKSGDSIEKRVSSKPKKQNNGGSYRDFFPIVQTIVKFLDHFRRKIRVNHLELRILLAGGDPCDLAVNYGKAWIALGNLLPQLERVFVIKKRNLEVECDFCGEKTCIFARMDATITLARVLHLLTWHGIKILKQLLQLKKLREGGANL